MRRITGTVVIILALAGCSVVTDRNSLGYGDYVALSCEQLGQEAVRLMREISDRSDYILQSDQERREKARQQLGLVKQASLSKGCT